LAQRIVHSPPFAKSERLKAMLLYVVEESIFGNAAFITEQRIGHAVFGKSPDYSPAEDSSVRANARLLRLRLHEYYDMHGRSEPMILSLPKGSYVPVFETAPESPAAVTPVTASGEAETQEPAPGAATVKPRLQTWLIAGIAIGCLVAGFLAARLMPSGAPLQSPPWPLSEVAESGAPQVVISDINYGLFCLLSGRTLTLEEYLHPSYPNDLIPKDATPRESRLAQHLNRASYVSFADTIMTNRLLETLGGKREKFTVRSARDFKMRDLADTNAIFIGSPSSNLWVSLFHDDLNFVETKPQGSSAAFVNRNPKPGEQPRYAGIPMTGSSGVDYAAIALLPRNSQHGKVLILQGAQQEGTEAAGLLLTTEQGRRTLRASLGLPTSGDLHGVYFEALIRSKAVGGSTAQTEIVATRRIN
jgi:hypothetical protein